MISDKYKCLYIHIPKTAGTSIENVMRDYDRPVETGSDHSSLEKYKSEGIDLNKYFKFTVVRNTYDRIYSVFNYTITGGNGNGGSIKLARQVPKDFKSFCKEYVMDGIDYKTIPMLQPQLDYIIIDGSIVMDFIGRFDNLENDFSVIRSLTGVKKKLPMTRVRDQKPYTVAYDQEIKDIIHHAYYKEIKYFNFTF